MDLDLDLIMGKKSLLKIAKSPVGALWNLDANPPIAWHGNLMEPGTQTYNGLPYNHVVDPIGDGINYYYFDFPEPPDRWVQLFWRLRNTTSHTTRRWFIFWMDENNWLKFGGVRGDMEVIEKHEGVESNLGTNRADGSVRDAILFYTAYYDPLDNRFRIVSVTRGGSAHFTTSNFAGSNNPWNRMYVQEETGSVLYSFALWGF